MNKVDRYIHTKKALLGVASSIDDPFTPCKVWWRCEEKINATRRNVMLKDNRKYWPKIVVELLHSSVLILVISFFLIEKDAYSAPFALIANEFDLTINTIDLGTNPPTVFGPFLGGQLGGSGLLQDVATTPDGNFALVGNSELQTVFLIDVSDPTNPTLADSLNIGLGSSLQEMDIAIAPNGQFALAVGGIGDQIGNQIAIIDIATFSFTTAPLTTPDAGTGCIDIAPDNQTVIVCDTLNNRIIFGPIDPSSGLTSETTLAAGNTPINATISPDGQTVLVANFVVDIVSGTPDDTVSVFRITGPGIVVAGTTPTVSGLPGSQQSIAFSPDGDRAFVVSVGPPDASPNQLSELQVNGPGDVSLSGAGVADLLSASNGGFFGVNVLAVRPDGLFALVGNNFESIIASPDVSLVNLSNFTVTNIDTNSDIPVGIDIVPSAVSPPKPRGNGNGCAISGSVQVRTGIANVLIPLIPAFAIGFKVLRRRNRNKEKKGK